jgi:hypothetical protein
MNKMRKVCSIVTVNLVVCIFLVFPAQAFSASLGYVDADAERVSQHINKADTKRIAQEINPANAVNRSSQNTNEPNPVAQKPKRVSVKRSGDWLQSNSLTLKVSIPDTENRAVWLSRGTSPKLADSFIVNLPVTKNTVDAKVSSDGSVVYSGYQQATDIAVQPFDDSVRILTVLNGTDSPSEYAYKVNLPTGGKIEKMENGGVLVLDSQGSLVGGFAPPWAVDNVGKKIPTHYDIRGNLVVQVVEHLGGNVSYPVVADPWLGFALIRSATWAYTPIKVYGRLIPNQTLNVTPTLWARAQAGGYLPGVAGWNELYAKYKNVGRGIKRNLDGMRDQYICHQQVVAIRLPTKSTWNLDEARPNLSYAATINASCNPGGPGIID